MCCVIHLDDFTFVHADQLRFHSFQMTIQTFRCFTIEQQLVVLPIDFAFLCFPSLPLQVSRIQSLMECLLHLASWHFEVFHLAVVGQHCRNLGYNLGYFGFQDLENGVLPILAEQVVAPLQSNDDPQWCFQDYSRCHHIGPLVDEILVTSRHKLVYCDAAIENFKTVVRQMVVWRSFPMKVLIEIQNLQIYLLLILC